MENDPPAVHYAARQMHRMSNGEQVTGISTGECSEENENDRLMIVASVALEGMTSSS